MTKRFVLDVRCEGASFYPEAGREIQKIMDRVIDRMHATGTDAGVGGSIMDTNGNTVGTWSIEETPEPAQERPVVIAGGPTTPGRHRAAEQWVPVVSTPGFVIAEDHHRQGMRSFLPEIHRVPPWDELDRVRGEARPGNTYEIVPLPMLDYTVVGAGLAVIEPMRLRDVRPVHADLAHYLVRP